MEKDRAPHAPSYHGQLEGTSLAQPGGRGQPDWCLTTQQGLKIKAGLVANRYEAGIKVTDTEMASLSIIPDSFHGEEKYRIIPWGNLR